MELILSEEEADLLKRILDHYLPELREEVYKTERFDWRESLKQDEEVLKRLMARLDALISEHGAVR